MSTCIQWLCYRKFRQHLLVGHFLNRIILILYLRAENVTFWLQGIILLGYCTHVQQICKKGYADFILSVHLSVLAYSHQKAQNCLLGTEGLSRSSSVLICD